MQTMLLCNDYNRLNYFDLCLVYLYKLWKDPRCLIYTYTIFSFFFFFPLFSVALTYLIYDSSTVQSTQMSS